MSSITTPARSTTRVLRSSFLLLLVVACSSTETSTGDGTPTTTPPDTNPPVTTTPDDTTGGGGKPDPKDAPPDTPWDPPNETGPVTFPYTAYKCGYSIKQVSPAKPSAIFHDAAAGAAPTPKNLHLTIAGNASSSVVISWRTDDATKQTEVRFGSSPDKLDKVAHGFSFSSSNGRQHELHLCGLKAGSTFYYDAGGAGGRSKVYKVTTAPDAATDVTVLVSGDTRSDPSVFGGMATSALAQGPTVAVMSGDAVANGGTQSQWDDLWSSAPDLFAQLPVLWAHGNHEALDELYFHQLALPDSGSSDGQIEQWYALTYGPIRFVVLNDTVSASSQITGAEKTFLDNELKAVDRNRTPFVVTMHHQPMYTTSIGHSSNTTLRKEWGPLLAKYKVNVDLAGHVHSYESTKPITGGTTDVVSDADGTRFFNFGGGGAPLYTFLLNQSWIQTRESTHGYAILKSNATAMTWSAVRDDNSAIETINIPKQPAPL